ncbi:MAG: amino acid racemase [Pseudomonadota bacterium]
MRLIGVLGGTGWRSTVLPYRYLNEEVERRLGMLHSARIALYSVDYSQIRTAYAGDDWSVIPALLLKEVKTLLSFSPDCWMIANNTLHKFVGQIASDLHGGPPLMHAVQLVRDHLASRGISRALLLGTRFTMEDDYYTAPLAAAGIDVAIPERVDRDRIQAIQTQLANGVSDPTFPAFFADLIQRHANHGCQAVVAACTELPLAITQDISSIEVIDPLRLQCSACVDFALAP